MKVTKKGLVKIGEAAKLLGVSIQTLRRWDISGKLAPIVTPGGTRLYSMETLGGINPEISVGATRGSPVVESGGSRPAPTSPLPRNDNIAHPENLVKIFANPVGAIHESPGPTRAHRGVPLHYVPFAAAAVVLILAGALQIYGNGIATTYKKNVGEAFQSVLAAETAARQYLEINVDTNVNGSLTVNGQTVLTGGGNPTFTTIKLTAPTKQIILGTGKQITLPDADTTLVGIDTVQTLTNKSISGSSNTLTNIPNSALTNSKVTVSPGTNLTGGGDVSLGNTITLGLKDNINVSSLSASTVFVNGNATISGSLLPAEDGGSQNLGSTDYHWNSLYVNNIYGPPVGSFWYWQRANGVVSPSSITDDLAIGGTATSSAKFQVFGLNGNATGGTYNGQTISSSANFTGTVNISSTLTAPTIQSTANQSLTLGGNTTGNVVIAPNNTTVATFTSTGLNMNNLPVINIGNSGTDFGSNGSLTLANSLTISSGGIEVTSGGITIQSGTLTINDGGGLVMAGGQSISSSGTLSLSTGDWGISTTGALTGISGITNDGSYTQSGVSANTFTGATTIANTASVSGGLTIYQTPVIASTAKQSLVFGDTNTGNLVFISKIGSHVLPATDSFYDLGSGSFRWNNIYANNIITPGSGTSGYLQRADGVIAPTNITDDLIIGATATASAKFQVFGLTGNATGGTYNGQTISSAANFTGTVNVAGNLTTGGSASVSGGLILFGTTSIQSTSNQTLTLGGNTTGNIVISPNNTTVATFTSAGLNMNNLPVINIGNSGTDFGTDGSLTLANKLTVTSGGIEVTAGGMTIQNGTLTINDGGGLVMAGGQSISSSGTISLSTNDWGISATGDMTGIGAITANGVLTVANTASVSGTLGVGGNTTLQGDLGVKGNTTLGGLSYIWPVSQAVDAVLTTNGSGLLSWLATSGSGTIGYWQRTGGSMAPTNITDSINLGSTATTSALVHFGGTANEDSFFNTGGLVTFGGVTAFTPVAAPGVTTGKLYNLTGNLAWNGSAICTAAGNCAGTSSSLGGSGSAGYISKWSGTYNLTTSLLYDTGTEIQIAGNASTSGNLIFNNNGVIAGTARQSLTLGDTNTGDLNFYSSSNKLTSAGNLTLAGTINATGIQTGGTTRIDTSGNLTNIGTASMSGALTLTTNPNIQSTSSQSLVLGGDSTGNVVIKPNNVTLATFTPTALDMNNLPILNIGNAGTDFGSDGSLTLANALTVTSGGIGVTSGGVTITAGGLGITAGGISLTGTQTISATGDLTVQSGASNNVIITGQNLTVNPAASFTGTATVSGTLGVGGNTTLQADLLVKGNTNLVTGSSYQINGSNVLSASTLGSGVITSSLTTVGALASGSIASGFGTISTGNTITTTGTMGTVGTTTFTGAGATFTSASISGNLTFDSAALIQTTKNQTLTIGGDSTGNIIIKPNNVTLATFTPTDLDLNNLPILNIGAAGTDFGSNGSLTLANALTVSSGGIGVTSGGITVTAGGIGVTAGNISLTGTQTISATGDLTVQSGGSNNLILTGANFSVTSAGLINGQTISSAANFTGTATISGTLGVGGEASLSAKLILGSTTPQINATNNRNLDLGFQNTGRVEFLSTANYVDVNGNLILNGNITAGTYNSATLNNTTLSGTSSFTITGGTGSGNTLTLVSSSHGTKGNIQFFDSNNYITSAGNLVLAGSLTTSSSASMSGALTLTTTPTIGTTSMQVLTLGGATTGSVQLSPKSTTGLFVDGTGNVGIGTTSPVGILHVAGQCVTGDTLLLRKRKKKKTGKDVPIGDGDIMCHCEERSDEVTAAAGSRSGGTICPRCKKIASHSLAMTDEFEQVRIDQIEAGDEILTLDEKTGEFVESEVKELMDKGIKEIWKLTTETGKTIRTTAQHPYLVNLQAFDTNVIYDEIFDLAEKAARKYYFDVLVHEDLFISSLNETIEISRLGWEHIAERVERRRSEKFFRFFALPKIVSLLKSVEPTYELGKDLVKKVEFWTFIGTVDGILINVVVEAINGGKKHLFSVQWKGEAKEDKKIELSSAWKQVRGVITPQLRRYYSKFIQELSSDKPSTKWVKVKDLSVGTQITTVDGYEEIVSIERLPAEQVWDIEVENTHNFVAGHLVNQSKGEALTSEDEALVLEFLKIENLDSLDLENRNLDVLNKKFQEFKKSKTSSSRKSNFHLQDIKFGGIVAHNTTGKALAMLDAVSSDQAIFTASSSGVTKFVITNAGMVGIGTPANTDTTLGTLSVRALSGTLPVATISGATSFASLVVDNSGIGDIFTASASGLNRFVIQNGGNIGIGTTSPLARLGVVGADSLNTSFAGNISGATGTGLVITNAGNVGIGTTGPGAKLEVNGNIGLSTGGNRTISILDPPALTAIGSDLTIQAQNTTDFMGTPGSLYLKAGQPSSVNQTVGRHVYIDGSNTQTPGVGASTYGNVLLQTQYGGNVGIGTTSPLAKLDIAGSASMSANLSLRTAGTSHNFNILDDGSIVFQGSPGGDAGLAAVMTIKGTGGVQVGAPTGGDKGVGSINLAGDIYKNNTAYINPDYVLEKYYTGNIVQYANKEGASTYQGLMSLPNLENYLKTNYALPGFGQDAKLGIFGGSDMLLARTEELTLYTIDNYKKIDSIASASASLQNDVATVSARLDQIPADISAQLALIPQIQDQIASLTVEMASVSGRLAHLDVSKMDKLDVLDTESLISGILDQEFKNSSSSASIFQLQDVNVATLSAETAKFSDSLKVIGSTQLAQTTIGGSLQVGLLHFDDLKAEISSLTGTVSILGDATVSGQLRVEKGIVLKDKTTGDDYCVQIDNGEIIKTKGACQ